MLVCDQTRNVILLNGLLTSFIFSAHLCNVFSPSILSQQDDTNVAEEDVPATVTQVAHSSILEPEVCSFTLLLSVIP